MEFRYYPYFCKRMVENKRNSGLVLLFFFLMIFFFYFIHLEKEKSNPESSRSTIVLSGTANSNAQAIISPATSTPEISIFLVDSGNGKYTFPDGITTKESVVRKQIIGRYFSSKHQQPFKNPIIGLTFRQKVPAQEKNDDIPPTA
jgi:hypothetical protein